MNKDYNPLMIVALAGVIILELYALSLGFNGILLTTVIGALLYIGGWSQPQLKLKRNQNGE